jgi:hypothetical protein
MPDTTELKPEMVHRIRCMARIPFKAIITTNYNSCFSGLEQNVEPALHNGSINPCEHWEDILRTGNDHEGNLLDDQEEVEHLHPYIQTQPLMSSAGGARRVRRGRSRGAQH